MDKRKGPDYIPSKDSAGEVVDSRLTLAQALDGSGLKGERRELHEAMAPHLALVDVDTYGLDGKGM